MLRQSYLTLLMLCLAASGLGQIRSGSIVGSVVDPAGASVAGVEVRTTARETNATYHTTTNEAGQYVLPYLQFGEYTVTASKAGFRTAEITGVRVATGETVRVPVKLEIGAVSSSIEVTAEAAGVEVESGSIQSTTSGRLVENLPNVNENPYYFATLQAGVVPREELNDGQTVNSFGVGMDGRRNFSAISINGGQAFTNDIQVDGVSVQGSAWNEAAVTPNRDSVQEVRTITNNFSAEYGRAQGVLQLTTRSGGNQYHGTVFDRVRNDFFGANTFGNNAKGIRRPALKINTFGATLGGHVPKSKLFFFTSYEGLIHHKELDYFKNVPTAAERVGDFSATKVSVSGTGVPVQLFDPFSAAQTDKNVYIHTPIPNSVIPRPDPYALKLFSYFPLPNRKPDNVFGNNNYLFVTGRTYRKDSMNSRLDYQVGKHSLYGTGGFTKGLIDTPNSWGPDNPFNSRLEFIGRYVQDMNPYGALGDTIVLTPSMVMDIRYGLNRIGSNNEAAVYPNFDYSQFGIPKELQAINSVPGAAPDYFPGGNLSDLNRMLSLHKRERQTNHQLVGSVTKTHDRWTFKAGSEYRVMLSNYIDADASFNIQTSNTYTAQLTTATGDLIGSPAANLAGYSPASTLFGAGSIGASPGRGVRMALAQKYFALYSQNDWRATARLTLFLGLRWDLQPGPTERYNRMSAIDLTAKNPYGTLGAYAFPGHDGYSRNMWDTHHRDFGPRVGFGYKLAKRFVVRGGYGLSYLPTNTGYFDGPALYGTDTYSAYTVSDVYGTNPAGVAIAPYYQVNRVVQGVGASPTLPSLYGGAQNPRFDRHNFLDGRAQQWNVFLETHLGDWQISTGYSASKGDHLPFAKFPANNSQLLPDSVLQAWRADYIARNGRGYIGTDQVPNPFQPANGALIPFNGSLGRATLTPQEALQPYPMLGSMLLEETFGFSRYDALMIQVNRRFARGLQFNAHYTFSKSTDFTQTEAQTNGYADTGTYLASNIDYKNFANNKKLSLTDVPHRFVATFLYDLPFGKGHRLAVGNRLLRAVAGGWKTSGAFTAQTGFPLLVTNLATGSLNGRPNRLAGVPIEVPKELQRWYDGKTKVTLPSGRVITPCNYCFLKYDLEAFQGQTLTAPNGSTIADLFWVGNSALDYSDFRGNGRWNLNTSLNRTFRATEKVSLDLLVQATNIMNHTEFRSGINRDLGAVNLTSGGSLGMIPGQGQNANFGTYTVSSTYDPREVLFELKVRF